VSREEMKWPTGKQALKKGEGTGGTGESSIGRNRRAHQTRLNSGKERGGGTRSFIPENDRLIRVIAIACQN